MRPLLITTEPAGAQHGSGTAVAVAALGEALALHGVQLSVARAAVHPLGQTLTRWRHQRPRRLPVGAYDAVLGVNGDGMATAAAAGLPALALPKALYASVLAHEGLSTRRLLRRHAAWEGAGCRAARVVVAPSRAAAEMLAREYAVASSRIVVIGEPFDGAGWRDALPTPSRHGRRVLVAAHLYPRKRVGDVLAAWPRVLRAVPGAHLDIAGGGPELGRTRRQARALDNVTVHGHLDGDALRRLHASSDVFVSASAHETFGYAVLEALASGLPVVAAAAPAVLELLAGAEAREVPVADPDALAGAIVESLTAEVRGSAALVNPPLAGRFEPGRVGAAYLDVLREQALR